VHDKSEEDEGEAGAAAREDAPRLPEPRHGARAAYRRVDALRPLGAGCGDGDSLPHGQADVPAVSRGGGEGRRQLNHMAKLENVGSGDGRSAASRGSNGNGGSVNTTVGCQSPKIYECPFCRHWFGVWHGEWGCVFPQCRCDQIGPRESWLT